MAKVALTPEVLGLVAERFKALAEPVRLQLLVCLRGGERSVGALVDETGLGQANVSKHLQMLHTRGFVTRRKEGLNVYYALADRSVFTLCDVMCGRIERDLAARREVFSA